MTARPERSAKQALADSTPIIPCARHLLTSYGLRSLAPTHANYQRSYRRAPRERDGAYHQGTVWGWLLGPFVLAHLRVYGDPIRAAAFLEPLANHLRAAGIGSASEIFDETRLLSPVGVSPKPGQLPNCRAPGQPRLLLQPPFGRAADRKALTHE